MINIILLNIAILLTAIPVGYVLAWLCRDELVDGRKWFKMIIYILVILLIVFLLVYKDASILFSLMYMLIITYISLFKSKDKGFVK